MVLTLNDIKAIATKMTEATKIDFLNFNSSFFRRRLLYCFEKMAVHKVSEIDGLLADKQKTESLLYYMLVAGTELFRDPGFWRSLKKQLSEKNKPIRIWIPELTNCYELYSLVIFLDAIGCEANVTVNSSSQKVIDEVKSYQIPVSTEELNRSNFERVELVNKTYEDYIETSEDKTQSSLRYGMLNNVTFRNRWFMNELPEKYDLIIMRNVLLAYNKPLHERTVAMLVGSLDSKGLLALGIKELPLLKTTMFSAVDAEESIYGRMN